MGDGAGATLKFMLAAGTMLGVVLRVRGDAAIAERTPIVMAFTGVNIVDVRVGRILTDRTVLIAGDRILAVQEESTRLAPGVTIVRSSGKYVMPGLWDMHVHVTDAHYLDLFVANGVTGVRDMGGGLKTPSDGCESIKPQILRKWRSEVTAGKRVGPELVISGPAVSGSGSNSSLPARSPTEARAAVRALQQQQVDFIKVYERIPLPAFNALAAEANHSRLPFAGHVSEAVGPLQAILTGQRSIEHIRDALLVCFTSEHAKLDRFFTEDRWNGEDRKWGRSANASCPQIITALQTRDAWLTPTLTVEKAKIRVEDASHVQDPRRQHLPRSVRGGYSAFVMKKLAQSPADLASERLWWRTQQLFVQRMSREGVRLLAGTDSACEGGLPGYSLHGELKELTAAGLSPAAALRTATIEPARYLSRKDEGEVLAGHRANLILLDRNPLDQIENTQAIYSVVLNGKLMQRSQLHQLLNRRREARP